MNNWKTMPVHPLAAMFPRPSETEHAALVGDMKERGYDKDQPIITIDGMIGDGISRRDAAIEAEVEPTFKEYKGHDLLGFVLSRNLHRRHLSTSQRQMLAVEVATLDKNNSVSGANLPLTQAEVAAAMNVSERGVKTAAAVLREAEPEVVEAVRNGTITVADASKIKAEPPKVQRQAVKDVEAGKASTAAEAAAKKKLCERCQRVGAVAGCEACKEARRPEPKTPAPDDPTDKDGKPYPSQARAAVMFVSRLRELTRTLDDCAALAQQIAKEPIGLYLDPNGIVSRLTESKKLVLASFPAHVCRHCAGKATSCSWCKGNGWQTKGGYQQCPEPK